MEIESLRLDFLTLIILINITKAQNISEKEEQKKNQKNPGHRVRPRRCATQATRDLGCVRRLGRARPRPHATPGSRAT